MTRIRFSVVGNLTVVGLFIGMMFNLNSAYSSEGQQKPVGGAQEAETDVGLFCIYMNESMHGSAIDRHDFENSEIHRRSNPELPSWAKAVLSAKSAAFTAAVATYPMDLAKLRMQAGPKAAGNLFRNPYQGFGSFSAAFCFNTMTNLVIFDHLKKDGWDALTAGTVSGYAAGIPSNPFWTYRVQKSLRKGTENDYRIKDFVRDLRKDPRIGFRGQAMNIPYAIGNGVFFFLVEKMNQEMARHNAEEAAEFAAEKGELSLGQKLFSSVFARIVVNGGTYSLDTLRIVRQKTGTSYSEIAQSLINEGKTAHKALDNPSTPSIIVAYLKPFYKGFGWATARATACTAIYMELHSYFKNVLGETSSYEEVCETDFEQTDE